MDGLLRGDLLVCLGCSLCMYLGSLATLLVTQCMSNTDAPYKCRELRDDYLECLHHRKEVGNKPNSPITQNERAFSLLHDGCNDERCT